MKQSLLSKSIILTAMLLCVQFSLAQPGWIWQNPLPQGNQLNGVQFITHDTGFAVGNGGAVIKTTNGGTTWSVLNTGTTIALQGLHFPSNSQNGFVVGRGGMILKTTNGGSTWEHESVGSSTFDCYAVNFRKDGQTGYIVGAPTTVIYETTNSGNTWLPESTRTSGFLPLRCIQFPADSDTGYIAGPVGTILKTTNGGAAWMAESTSVNTWLTSLSFPKDARTGYAVGYNQVIVKTTDYGTTWMNVFTGQPYVAFESVSFTRDNQVGIAVGDFAYCNRTTDGGATWQLSQYGNYSSEGLSAVAFAPDTMIGYIAGSNGLISTTTDSGATWSPLRNTATTVGLFSVSFPVDARTGYAVGGWSNSGTILKTTNGGGVWIAETSSVGGSLKAIQFPFGADTGFVVGDYGKVLKTTDQGNSWTPQSTGSNHLLSDVDFPVDAQIGYIVGWWGSLYKTTNGGTQWNSLGSYTNDFNSVCFPGNTDTGYAADNDGNILKTTDGGMSWVNQISGTTSNLYSIRFPRDTRLGYAAGWNGSILKTTDGGAHWNAQSSGTSQPIKALYFCDINVGYAVGGGAGGSMQTENYNVVCLKTTDGGVHWIPIPVPYSSGLTSVSFPTGPDTGYIVGELGGTILKTVNGGGTVTGVRREGMIIPNTLTLEQNYPNPFNPSTVIRYQLPVKSKVTLKVYDVLGREVATLVNEVKEPGTYTVQFDGSGLSSGVYLYRIQAGTFVQTRKLLMLK